MARYTMAAVLTGVAAVGLAYSVTVVQPPAPPAGGPKWEYKVVRGAELTPDPAAGAKDDALNKLGEQGWELVVVVAEPYRVSGAPDPAATWDRNAPGRVQVNVLEEKYFGLRSQLAEFGVPLPPDGSLTKVQFVELAKQNWKFRTSVTTEPTYYLKRPKR